MTHQSRDGSVEFRFFRPAASCVRLAGDFNGWSREFDMNLDANGWWTLLVQFEPGDYRFHYKADGEWFADFASNGVEATKSGWNSILVVLPTEANPPRMKQNNGAGIHPSMMVA